MMFLRQEQGDEHLLLLHEHGTSCTTASGAASSSGDIGTYVLPSFFPAHTFQAEEQSGSVLGHFAKSVPDNEPGEWPVSSLQALVVAFLLQLVVF